MACRTIRDVAAALLAAVMLLGAAAFAWAEGDAGEVRSHGGEPMTVGVDEARVVRLNRVPSAVIVGNPLIADVAVQENGILIVVGKNYGTTNLIALDAAGGELVNIDLSVRTSGRNAVSLFRGTGRVSLSCAPRCEQELDVGDDLIHYDGMRKSVSDKIDLSTGASQPQ